MYIYTHTYTYTSACQSVCQTVIVVSWHTRKTRSVVSAKGDKSNELRARLSTLTGMIHDHAYLSVLAHDAFGYKKSSLIFLLLPTWRIYARTRPELASVRRGWRKKATGGHPDCCEGRSPPISSEISRLTMPSDLPRTCTPLSNGSSYFLA